MADINKSQSTLARQRNNTGDLLDTPIINTTGDTIINLGVVAEKITYVMNGTLTGSISYSINGKDFFNSTALAATGVPTSYSTHLVKIVKITASGGTGKVTIAVK